MIDLAALGDDPDHASFAELEKRAQLYDPELLRAVQSYFLEGRAPKDNASKQKTVKISAANLRPGARLVSNIETTNGTLVLAAGNEISQAQIERLRNLQKYRKLKEPLHVIQPKAPSKKAAKQPS